MSVSCEQLRVEELRMRYEELLEDPTVYPTVANWQFICDHRLEGLGHLLLAKYVTSLDRDELDREELHQVAIEQFPQYLQAVDRLYALEVVYEYPKAPEDVLVDLIRRCRLFDAARLLDWLDEGRITAVMAVLDVYQPEYEPEDLEAMRQLSVAIHRLPRTGRVEERRGLFGVGLKYICPNGHVNSPDTEYCTHSGCGLNAIGLTADQMHRLDILDSRIAALTHLME